MAERGTKLILDTKSITDVFFNDAKLLGIMAPVKDYQFCWHLNSNIGLDFRVNNEIEIKLIKKKRTYFFAVYEYIEPTKFLCHYVYNNQFDGEYLLPEFKHFDFLWLMKGDEVSEEALKETMQIIKLIPSVQLVTELKAENVKNKEHLVF